MVSERERATSHILRRRLVEGHGDQNDVVFEILEKDLEIGTV